jgi:hypothetical protein
VDQHTLSGPGFCRSMQHLIRRDVVQHHGDRLRWVQACGHADKLALGQANVLRVAPVDGHGSDCLARFKTGYTLAQQVDASDEIPTRRIGHARRLGVDSLARQDVWQTDPRRQHPYPNFTHFWFGAFLLEYLKHARPTVVSDDDSRVSHWASLASRQPPALLPVCRSQTWHCHRLKQ